MAVKEKTSLLTDEQIEAKCKTIEQCSHRLQSIIRNCKNPKFTNLERWIQFESNSFAIENKKTKKTKHKSYKRGSIVYVNFGTSIGSEFSGYHFAITLNQNDNPCNDTITVIPLTSKNKKYNLSLGKELVNQIFDNIMKETINVLNLAVITDYLKAIDDNHTKGSKVIDTFIKEHPNLENDLDDLYEIIAKNSKDISPIMTTIGEFLIKHNDDLPFVNGMINFKDIDFIGLISKDLELIKEVKSHYEDKDKVSYASINDITTISKHRIKPPLNRMDPIGKITVSSLNLKSIEIELMKRLAPQLLTTNES